MVYRLKLTRREKKRLLRAKWLIFIAAIFVLVLAVWLIWLRPAQLEARINSFEACVAAGNSVQQSYPEVCLTKNGKRFANPEQAQAHQASQSADEELVAPTNPQLLNLDIEEWGVRVPLTDKSFDLVYAYIKNGGDEQVMFTYKRLVNLGICKGDVGLKLTRSLSQNQPPFNPAHPAPSVQVGKFYYYVSDNGQPCYDFKNPEHAELAKKIAGDKTLSQATADLLPKMVPTPSD